MADTSTGPWARWNDAICVRTFDLLKVDAEGCEGDWSRIRQIIVEVHQQSGEVLDHVLSLIDRHGYRYKVERSVLNQLPMIYASR